MGTRAGCPFRLRRHFLPGEVSSWIDEIRHQLTVLRLRTLSVMRRRSLELQDPTSRCRSGWAAARSPCPPARERLPLSHASPGRSGQRRRSPPYLRPALCHCLRDQIGASPQPRYPRSSMNGCWPPPDPADEPCLAASTRSRAFDSRHPGGVRCFQHAASRFIGEIDEKLWRPPSSRSSIRRTRRAGGTFNR